MSQSLKDKWNRDLSLKWGLVAATAVIVGFALLESNWKWTASYLFALLSLFAAASIWAVAHNRELGDTDALTRLANKRAGEEALQAALQSGKPVSVLYFDWNNMKRMNSLLGSHSRTDLVLRWGAMVARSLFRFADVVARDHGDEFFVICPNTELKAAIELARRLLAALHVTVTISEDGDLWVKNADSERRAASGGQTWTLEVGITIGVVCSVSEKNPSVRNLLSTASELVVSSKEQGERNCVVSAPVQAA